MKHLPKNFQGKCSATQSLCAQEVNLFNSTNRQSIKKYFFSYSKQRNTPISLLQTAFFATKKEEKMTILVLFVLYVSCGRK